MKQILFLLLTILSLDAFANIESRLEQKIRENQQNFPDGDIKSGAYVKKAIDYMYLFDQEIRHLLIKDQSDIKVLSVMSRVDGFHTSKMKEILLEHEWITISKFGVEYDDKAWLLIQHADNDPFFQAGVLFILANLVDQGETSKKNYAYLYDRVAINFPKVGMKQRYGTQLYIEKNGDIKLLPYQGSLIDLDIRRKTLGLEPLSKYLEQVKESYTISRKNKSF